MSLSNKKFQAVLFDLDGTLVETLGDFVEALNRTAIEHKIAPFAVEQVRSWIGQGSEHLLRQALRSRLPDSQVEAWLPAVLASYFQHYATVNGMFSATRPGANECLQALAAKGLPLACVTNKPHQYAATLLQHLGLAAYFQLILGGDQLPHRKPHPLPIQHAAQQLAVSCENTLMVGDSIHDAHAARAAGCCVLLLKNGYGEPVNDSHCDALVEDFYEVAKILGI